MFTSFSVCIITAEPVPYGLYIAFKFLMLHILPVIILIITLIKPRTKVIISSCFTSFLSSSSSSPSSSPGPR
jgi:hypothetical protein